MARSATPRDRGRGNGGLMHITFGAEVVIALLALIATIDIAQFVFVVRQERRLTRIQSRVDHLYEMRTGGGEEE